MKRNTTIDMLKGFGIILIVIGHSGSPFYHFVYLFHVAIFFIASGYCYNPDYSRDLHSVLSFVTKKFKTLWFPYVLWNSVFVLLHNVFVKINVYNSSPLSLKKMLISILKNCFFIGGTQMGGATWFLACLMYLTVGYCILDYLFRRIIRRIPSIHIQSIFSIIFLALGYLCSQRGWGFAGIERFLSFYCFIHIGFLLRTSGIYDRVWKVWTHLALLLGSLIPLLFLQHRGTIDICGNSYPNPAFLLISTLLGWQLLYELATLVQKIPRLTGVLSAIGQSSLSIMIFHFLAFKPVSLLIVLLYKEPLSSIAAFPNLYGNQGWWILYTLVGVSVPFAFHQIYRRARSH